MNYNEGALSIILSTCSLLAAIGIPALIAYRQNKIVLYDKRLACYQQFLALKSFYNCCKEFCPTDESNNADSGDKCRSAYLSIHCSVLDKNYQQNGIVLQSAYVLAGLESDKNMLASLAYLGFLDDEKILQGAANTLESFVKCLFGISNVDGGNVDQAKLKFEAAFSQLLKSESKCGKEAEDAFEKKLKKKLKL